MGSTGSDTRARRVCSLCLGLLALLDSNGAHAQPSVRVRSTTHLVLHAQPMERGIELEGALLDDLDAPIEGRRVTLVVRAASAAAGESKLYSARSASDGSFRLQLAAIDDRYQVRAEFEGDLHLAACDDDLTIDPEKADVRLKFVAPRDQRIELDVAEHEIMLVLTSKRGGGGLEVTLDNERGDRLAHGTSNADGEFRARVRSAALGPPAWGRLVASTAGDAQRSPAHAELALLRFASTELALNASFSREPNGLRWRGTLRARGAPLANKAIALFVADENVATVLTDASGAFRDSMAPHVAGARSETLAVRARFTSDVEWLGSSASRTLVLRASTPMSFGPLWMLLPIAISAALVYSLWRREPRRSLRARSAIADRSVGIHAAPIAAAAAAAEFRIAGRVLDANLQRPIADARVELVDERGQSLVLIGSGAGDFESAELTRGKWNARIEARGFRRVEGSFTIPHRGEWREMRVLLASLRAEAVSAYKPVALHAATSHEDWERWTLRETIERAAAAGRATESFVQLTERVEQVAYARATPNEDDVTEIEQAALRITKAPDPSAHS